MKRAGFTMIELIFVIVILGIMAAVALPKFIGVSEQAHVQKVEAFAGTMNRTVGPSMWAVSLANGNGGAISTMCDTLAELQLYINEVPEELSYQTDCTFDANATGGGTKNITFVDGNATNAPTWAVN
ncbi:MAG: type II secretion system protein [Sulfurimonas sp.]|jgi:prepilin-type N-terminal cleavage/methylation domain-containing protein|nr:type II secretion system protein [Sulfurimonas sp.]